MSHYTDFQFSIEDKDLKKLINKLKNQRIYTNLIILDLTYLNSSKYGMSGGTHLKQKVVDSFKNRRENDLIYEKIIGGKLFFFTENPLESSFKQTLDNLSRQELGIEDSKVIFILENVLGPFNEDLSISIQRALSIENHLSTLRNLAQDKIKEIEKGKNINDFQQIEKQWEQIDKQIQPQMYDINDPKSLYKVARNSKYLTNAVYYFVNKNYGQAHDEVIKYFIWNQLQKLLFSGFKTEKVYHFIDKSRNNIKLPNESLKSWFDSAIKPLYPFMNSRDLEYAKNIEQKIINPDLSDKELRVYLAVNIKELVSKLNIRGIFNIPLTNLTPSQEAFQFLNRQFYLIYKNQNYQIILNKWFNSGSSKQQYKVASEPNLDKLWTSFCYHVPDLFSHETLPNKKIHFAFLEVDGFNAFNTYLFPNDSDQIYNRLLNIIFETANPYIWKDPDLFKSLTVGIMGDEFFFFFANDIKKNDSNLVSSYLKDVKNNMINLVGNYKFANTRKVKRTTEKGEVCFRELITDNNSTSSPFEIEIARLGISGAVKLNEDCSYSNFKVLLENAETYMEFVKENEKGKIIKFESYSIFPFRKTNNSRNANKYKKRRIA